MADNSGCTLELGPLCSVMAYLASTVRVEVVGYIIGGVSEEGRRFTGEALVMARNISKSPEVEFVAEPLDILVAHSVAERLGKEVIGVFHTHPCHAPEPSSKDREGMKAWPLVWVIASPAGLSAHLQRNDEVMVKCQVLC